MAHGTTAPDQVVALVAVCDLVTPAEHGEQLRARGVPGAEAAQEMRQFARGLHCSVVETAHLRDDRTVVLRDGLGWTSVVMGDAPHDPWETLDVAALTRDVLTVVLPDDAEETGQDHPWELFVTVLSWHGLGTTVQHLQGLPYLVALAPRVHARLADRADRAGRDR